MVKLILFLMALIVAAGCEFIMPRASHGQNFAASDYVYNPKLVRWERPKPVRNDAIPEAGGDGSGASGDSGSAGDAGAGSSGDSGSSGNR